MSVDPPCASTPRSTRRACGGDGLASSMSRRTHVGGPAPARSDGGGDHPRRGRGESIVWGVTLWAFWASTLLVTYVYASNGRAGLLLPSMDSYAPSQQSRVGVYNISVGNADVSDSAGAALEASAPTASSLHLRKASSDGSFLVYYHVPKSGGTSFDSMFQKKFRGVEASGKTKNCGLLRSCCESQSKIEKVLSGVVKTCDHFTYEGHMPLFERISAKKPNARLLIRKTREGGRLFANKLLNSKTTPFSSSSSTKIYGTPFGTS